jgi:enoyl-CoA hydratase/carnithine racemase
MSTTVELLQNESGVSRVVFQSANGVQILSLATLDQLETILKTLKRDKTVRILVFEAQGRTFLAGADLAELKGLNRKSARRYAQEGQRLFQRIAELPAISIAAIHAACDMRLAAAGATIGAPEVKLGLIPGWGGTVRSTLLVGPALAKRMILSGEHFPAVEALRMGVVDAVFPDDEFRTSVDERISMLLKAGPNAAAASKRLIADIYAVELDDLLEMEAQQFAACYATSEPAEGISAFLEKRPAGWGVPRSSA